MHGSRLAYCLNRLEFRGHADAIDALRSKQHFNQESVVRDPQFADRSRGDRFLWAVHG